MTNLKIACGPANSDATVAAIMTRNLVGPFVLMPVLLMTGMAPSFAQTTMTKNEAEALLEKITEEVNLWDTDAPSFNLSASIHYELAGKVHQGSYELIRKAPDQYRESFRMTGETMEFGELEIASGNKLYVKRNTPILTLPLWTVRTTLRSVKSDFSPLRLKVTKVYSTVVNGKPSTCIDYQGQHFQKRLCLAPATGEAVSLFSSPVLSGLAPLSIKEWKRVHDVELADFVRIGGRLYPLSLKRTEGVERLELKITTLEELKTVDEEVFRPPAGASSFEWCAEPTISGKLDMARQILGEMKFPGGTFLHYVLVGPDGRVMNSAPMLSAGPRIDEQMTDRIRNTKFPVRSCAGKPIQYETVVPATVAVQLPR